MIDKKDFDIIRKAFLVYEAQFKGNDFIYTYLDKRTRSIQSMKISFASSNFMHLCGVTYKNKNMNFGPKQFYSSLKKQRIVLSNIQVKSDGTTGQKLQVIDKLELLIKPGVRISDAGKFASLEFDKAIRTGRMIMALTCVKTGIQYAPQSLLSFQNSTQKRSAASFNISHQVTKLERVKTNSNEIPDVIFDTNK